MKRCLLVVTLLACMGHSFAQSVDSANQLKQMYLRRSRHLNAAGTALGLGGIVTVIGGGLMALGNGFDKAYGNAPGHPHAPAVLGIAGTVATIAGIVLFAKSQDYKSKAKRLSVNIQTPPSPVPGSRMFTGLRAASNRWEHGKPHDVSISMGLSDEGYGYPNGLSETKNSGVSTVNFNGEYYFKEAFSAGVYGSYTYSFFKYTASEPNYKDTWKGWDAGIKATLYPGAFLSKHKPVDIYLSAFAGYTGRALTWDKQFNFPDSFNYRIHAMSAGGIAGLRLPIVKEFAAYGEVGFSRRFFIGGGVYYRFAGRRK